MNFPQSDHLRAYYPLDYDGGDVVGSKDGEVGDFVTFVDGVRSSSAFFYKWPTAVTVSELAIVTPFRFVGSTNAGAETAFAESYVCCIYRKKVFLFCFRNNRTKKISNFFSIVRREL